MKDKLKRLEENIRELTALRKSTGLRDFEYQKTNEWALRYGLLESIQIIIDISCHLISKYNMGNPASYGECIELLGRHDYIDDELKEKITGMVGLRNILVHEYVNIEVKRLYELLEHLNDMIKFVNALSEYLD